MNINGISSTTPKRAATPAPKAEEAPVDDSFQKSYKGYDTSYLDRSVRPQDDFYQFALGGYAKNNPIPADQSTNGIYPDLRLKVANQLHGILDNLVANPGPKGSIEQKLGDFYASGMDLATIEAAGAKPLQPLFDSIDKIQTNRDVQNELADLHAKGFGGLFAFGANADMKNPDQYIGDAGQAGISLPTKDYYTDPKKADTRDAYVKHVGNMFELLGQSPTEAAKSAAAVMRIETSLAEASLSPAERRDPKARYHPTDRAELAKMTPNFSWDNYFEKIGRPDIQSINVSTPKFFTKVNEMMGQVPAEDWKAYLKWNVINATAGSLSSKFEQEQFAFSKQLSGVEKQPDRFKKIVASVESHLGMALSQKYVEQNFSPEAKAKAIDMVNNVKLVLRDEIEHGWMQGSSKQEALAKIDTLSLKIGFPDKWKDYSALEVDRGPYVNNLMRAWQSEAREDLDRIGQPVDKSEWHTNPCTVNANYSPSQNPICFPAARLQFPFFDVNQDDALNYGATGATVGHEISHGFDDSGSQFDAQGRLRNWFTPEDLANFTKRADAVADQMSEFSFDGQQNNGKLVEGEAIADQGGVELAYKALMRARKGQPEQITPDGFSDKQRFFLGYALCRATNARPAAAHAQMSKDPHPLGPFRVNAPLSNEPSFFEAFDVKPGDPMQRPKEKRNHLWEIEPEGLISNQTGSAG